MISVAAATTAMAVMAGTALAADQTQMQFSQQSSTQVKSSSSDSVQITQTQMQTQSAGQQQLSSKPQMAISGSSDPVTAASANNGQVLPDNAAAGAVDAPTTGNPGEAMTPVSAPALGEAGSSKLPKVEAGDPFAVALPAVTQAANGDQRALAAPANAGKPETIVFQAHTLQVQPVIMSRPAMNNDLAAAIPSAPLTAQLPAQPAKATGLLTALTCVLASTTITKLGLVLVSLGANWPVETSRLCLGLFVLGLAVVAAGGFSGLLRRAGYAHAARSDAGAALLYFATSFLMGYVSAARQLHNPFLMVSETKIFSVTSVNA